MAHQVLEGTWEEISRQSQRFAGHRVRITILSEGQAGDVGHASGPTNRTFAYFGMFRGTSEPTEEDFRSAEFHGDPDDGLDWR
ncbi:MAG: hypothetical protein K0Q72_2347 [Armatimonadetes bacterium]|jgi:hypothetical protein|nr:hypothetical protein [Armatimonadota bacterium]